MEKRNTALLNFVKCAVLLSVCSFGCGEESNSSDLAVRVAPKAQTVYDKMQDLRRKFNGALSKIKKIKENTYRIHGEITDQGDSGVLQIWGTAFPNESSSSYQAGFLRDEGNIVVINPVENGITSNYYSGNHLFVRKTIGQNAFGASVPIYVYEDTSKLTEAGSMLVAIVKASYNLDAEYIKEFFKDHAIAKNEQESIKRIQLLEKILRRIVGSEFQLGDWSADEINKRQINVERFSKREKPETIEIADMLDKRSYPVRFTIFPEDGLIVEKTGDGEFVFTIVVNKDIFSKYLALGVAPVSYERSESNNSTYKTRFYGLREVYGLKMKSNYLTDEAFPTDALVHPDFGLLSKVNWQCVDGANSLHGFDDILIAPGEGSSLSNCKLRFYCIAKNNISEICAISIYYAKDGYLQKYQGSRFVRMNQVLGVPEDIFEINMSSIDDYDGILHNLKWFGYEPGK